MAKNENSRRINSPFYRLVLLKSQVLKKSQIFTKYQKRVNFTTISRRPSSRYKKILNHAIVRILKKSIKMRSV